MCYLFWLIRGAIREIPVNMPAKLLAICLTMAALISARPAVACTCATPETIRAALQQSSAVFLGKVTEISRPLFDRIGITSSGLYQVKFEVTKSWKGTGSDEFVVKTRLSGEACGYPFNVEEDYLVYVAETIGDIETGICTGTRPAIGAEADMEALDALVGDDGQ